MVERTVRITNAIGLHLRPAGVLARAMMKFECEVTLLAGEKTVNAKSIMNLMAACIKCGDEVTIRCDGADEQAALVEAARLIESGLGETGA